MVNFGFSPVSTDPVSYYYNIENGLRMFRSVMAKLKAGQTIKPNVCCFGSSSLAGFGSTDNNILGFIGLLRSALATQFGDVGTGIITQDSFLISGSPLIVFTGTWSQLLSGKSSSSNGASFSTSFNGTGVSLFAKQNTGYGSLSIVIDGGAPDVWSLNGTLDYNKIWTKTGLSAGDHTIVVTKTDANYTLFHGLLPIKGTAGININNFGIYGAYSTSYIPSGSGILDTTAKNFFLDYWAPVLSIICIGSNDASKTPSSIPLDQHEAALQSLITACKVHGDVLLIAGGLRSETSTIPISSYTAVQKQLAKPNNCAFIDMNTRWGNVYATANTTYGFYSDTVHPSNAGHQDYASAISKAFDL